MTEFLKQKVWHEMIVKEDLANLIVNNISLPNFTLSKKVC